MAVPSRGGNTHFASMYMAYDALPERLKTLLEGRRGAFTYGGRRKAQALLNEEDRDRTPAFHPMIRDAFGDRAEVALFRSRARSSTSRAWSRSRATT